MASPHQQLILIAALLVSAATLASAEVNRLTIRNGLDGGQNLQVHCKDKNNDYGEQQVPSGSEYNIDIRVGFNPDYFCSFFFDNAIHWFDVYIEKREYLCQGQGVGRCYWIAKNTGPCALSIGTTETCFPWN